MLRKKKRTREGMSIKGGIQELEKNIIWALFSSLHITVWQTFSILWLLAATQ
jgi:hypothetical protein